MDTIEVEKVLISVLTFFLMYSMDVQYVCVFYLAALSSDDANVSRDSVSSFDFHQIPHN